MQRRTFVTRTLSATALAVFAQAGRAADPAKLEPLPQRKTTKIAFLLGEHANVIDTAGPWEVFQDVEVNTLLGSHSPFELYTVGTVRGDPDHDGRPAR